LHELGYVSAQIIGRACAADDPATRIRLSSF
jgi:hypothetical protein